jgi:DNA-directed RNA polymerase subunit RPC12/RpoP
MKWTKRSFKYGWICASCGQITMELNRCRPTACLRCGSTGFTDMIEVYQSTKETEAGRVPWLKKE